MTTGVAILVVLVVLLAAGICSLLVVLSMWLDL
jgi:hypothetical protein